MEPNANPSDTDMPWVWLNKLLSAQQKTILERESGNEHYIYIYNMLKYWVAFEQSAYQLCRIFPGSTVSILHVKTFPLPLVMASVGERSLKAYSRKHLFKESGMGGITLAAAPIQPEDYDRWHREAVKGTI